MHLSLVLGQVGFVIFFTLYIKAARITPFAGALSQTIMVLCVAGSLISVATGLLLFNRQMARISAEISLADKLVLYKAAYIRQLAFIQGATMFSIFLACTSANYPLLTLPGIYILLFIYLKPSAQKVGASLKLSGSEIESLQEM